MLRRTTRDVLGRAAYMRRTCEILESILAGFAEDITGTEQLTPWQEAEMDKAYAIYERASEHLELARQFIDDWDSAVHRALNQEPR